MTVAVAAWKSLEVEVLGVHAHHENLLVVGAVEDSDLTARREPARVAPQVVVVELLDRRHLEAVDGHALRVHPAHHVADRSVLARSVERLEHHENTPHVLRGEARLVLGEHLHPLGE